MPATPSLTPTRGVNPSKDPIKASRYKLCSTNIAANPPWQGKKQRGQKVQQISSAVISKLQRFLSFKRKNKPSKGDAHLEPSIQEDVPANVQDTSITEAGDDAQHHEVVSETNVSNMTQHKQDGTNAR